VPFDLSFASCNLGERLNSAGRKIVDPDARLGHGQKDGVASFCPKCWLVIGLIQHTPYRMESVSLPREAYRANVILLFALRFHVLLLVVLKDWVIETNETECWSNSSTSFAKSASDRVSRSTL
jgi:hypothetical protein